MSVVGIIAEFNPLHNGHKKLIDFAKQNGDTVVCAISGNFVQRGDVALLSKQKRAEAALVSGADIVAEMPVLWSMSTAQNFALCGVWQLYNLGCDTILFGSECGDIDKLIKTADILLSDKFSFLVTEKIKSGITFAAARQEAAAELGADADILSKPNNNLGIEYIIAARNLRLPLEFKTLSRIGEDHDSMIDASNFVSSSFIRGKILDGDIAYGERFIPLELRGKITEDNVADIRRIDRAALAVLRLKSQKDFENLPDLSEGIENKLYFSVRVANGLDELYNMIKSKRYTLARCRRLVLSAVLSFDKKFFMTTPPYVRVLGFSNRGEEHIKSAVSTVPVIMRVSDIKNLDRDALEVFETECRATDLYALCLNKPQECGLEYKYKLLKTEC
ncbi:MAG: nucleotidyltransferase family protein [Clostridia bacterium]|nr:nucleotidyltransferase family protein [Clostridia bacterium]